jgi:hypothetical protein
VLAVICSIFPPRFENNRGKPKEISTEIVVVVVLTTSTSSFSSLFFLTLTSPSSKMASKCGSNGGGGDLPIHVGDAGNEPPRKRLMTALRPYTMREGGRLYVERRDRLGTSGVEVPPDCGDPKLYNWGKNIWDSYKSRCGNKKFKKYTPMSDAVFEYVKSIGYPYDGIRLYWENQFEAFKQYLFATDYQWFHPKIDDPIWLEGQRKFKTFTHYARKEKSANTLCPHKVRRLDEIGFEWSKNVDIVDALGEFFEQHGHFRIRNNGFSSGNEKNCWKKMQQMRMKYHRHNDPSDEFTWNSRVRGRLDAINFDWNGGSKRALWNDMPRHFEEVKRLVETDVDVTVNELEIPNNVKYWFHPTDFVFGFYGNPLFDIIFEIGVNWYKEQQREVLKIRKTRAEKGIAGLPNTKIKQIDDDTLDSVALEEVLEIATYPHYGVIVDWMYHQYGLRRTPETTEEEKSLEAICV